MMKLDRCWSGLGLTLGTVWIWAGLAAPLAGVPAAEPAAPRRAVALELMDRTGEGLTPVQRGAVLDALLSIANTSGVIVCDPERISAIDKALELCSRENLPQLGWAARIQVSSEEVLPLLKISLDLETRGEAPAGPPELTLIAQTLLQSSRDAPSERVVAHEIRAALLSLQDLYSWFEALGRSPRLLAPDVDTAAPAPRPESAPAPAPEPESAPEPVPAEKAPAAAAVEQRPRPKVEIQGTGERARSGDAASSSFRVRLALIGGGFEEGSRGRLRISPSGLTFTAEGRTAESWSLPWKDFQEARKDGGVWDAPYPLVVVERGGRRHYIARIDEKGRYLSGDPILSAIAQGRRRAPGTARPEPKGDEVKEAAPTEEAHPPVSSDALRGEP